ncbi:MAG: histidine phosphatase family protein [Planctomycetota bacterium]
MPPCPAPETCWLYLVRHGATDNNRATPPRLQGRRTDPPLSVEGREQARQTGTFLAARPLHAVYSSPLLRARQTAEAITEAQGLSVQVVDEFVEVDVGAWEGRSWEEIQQTDPQAYEAFMADATKNPYLGGETLQTVLDRALPAFQRLAAGNLGRQIAVVAHNVVNRAYLAHLMGVPVARYRSIPQDNCGLNLLRCRKDRVKVVTINGCFHLAEEPSTNSSTAPSPAS